MDSCGIQPSAADVSAYNESRIPLTTQTNSSQSSSLQQQLRHKSTFIHRIDSSEEPPSSHDSIFEAECCSNVNSEDSSHKNQPWQTLALESVSGLLSNANTNENMEVILLSPVGMTPIIYGHGTPLTTIIEQKSSTTMRTIASTLSRAHSASDLACLTTICSSRLLRHPSFELSPNVTLRSPRHRKSFSANDLEPLNLSQPMKNTASSMPSEVYEIYAQPRRPIIPPVSRSPTPPGLPSWTAAQNPYLRNATLQQGGWTMRTTLNRVRRFFGVQPSGVQLSSGISLPVHTDGQNLQSVQNAIQGPRGVPRFRPPASGHGQTLGLHPFVHAGQVALKGVDLPSPTEANPQIRPQPSIQTPQASRRANKTQRERKIGQKVRFASCARNSNVNEPFEMSPTTSSSVATVAQNRCSHRQNWNRSLLNPSNGLELYASNAEYIMLSTAIGTPSESTVNSSFIISLPSSPTSASIPPGSTAASEEQKNCWKCRVEYAFAKIGDLREKSTTWCFWMCCGVDLNDDGTSVI